MQNWYNRNISFTDSGHIKKIEDYVGGYQNMSDCERRRCMNRGEWSEPYVALKLLGEQKIYMADENGNINLSEWMIVLKLVRRENKDRLVSYTCRTDMGDVLIEVNRILVTQINAIEFFDKAEILKQDILSGRKL